MERVFPADSMPGMIESDLGMEYNLEIPLKRFEMT